ncbi:MAG TPA: D-alanyl-D-alanine carboxypeptidase family protein [Pyrinomonadaceae bacterium]|nr:D-alanyl-D-alanine carboxypeptidase family protein [Pyrinomonadaceae bacterium]
MLSKKTYILIALSGLLSTALFGFVFAQSKFSETAKKIIIKPNSIDVKKAIEQNSNLKNNLKWVFGNKPQTGWYLYVSLIQKLIGTESAPETEKFALALANWQQRSNLEANGILDETTLYKMVEFWQSQRLNSSVYPNENELLTAPIADFYDPTRDVELLKVKREAYLAFKQMVSAAMADKSLKLTGDEKFLKIISAFRSREYQEKLRQKSPNSGRAGLALNSPHFTGCALDIYVGGEPVTTKDENRAIQVETPVYKWLVKNAEKFGFYPYYYEPWHWEYAPKK